MSCNHKRKPKQLPYGSTKGLYWCFGCDAALVPESYGKNPKPIKKRERRKAKIEIIKEMEDIPEEFNELFKRHFWDLLA